MEDKLNYYIRAFQTLRTDSGKHKYPGATLHRAPHKPLLLLTIMDLIAQGSITKNFVPISAELADLYTAYWQLLMPEGSVVRLFLPFFHLKGDGFWHLIPQHGKEAVLESIRQIGSAAQLRESVLGAQVDEDLYDLLCLNESRNMLRAALLNTYFSEEMHEVLLNQANTNLIAHQYSQHLLLKVQSSTEDERSKDDISRPVRDQGFRKAIVTAYDHRCVLCGIRLVTYEGRTVATAAHIIPWSMSYNDDPSNGLCLCRLCHWVFDIGLAAITPKYRIRLSNQISAEGNLPGYISTLDSRPIFEPIREFYNPDTDALKWHKNNIFLD